MADLDKIVQLISVLSGVLSGVWVALHSYRQDKLNDKKEADRVQEYAMKAIREHSEEIQKQFDKLKSETDKQSLLQNQQIARLTEENRILTTQLDKYLAKFGKLED